MRVAKQNAYWFDLCNDKYATIRITSLGWQVIDSPDVLFYVVTICAQTLPGDGRFI